MNDLRKLFRRKIAGVPVGLIAAAGGLLLVVYFVKRRQQQAAAPAGPIQPRSSQPQAQYQLPTQSSESSGGVTLIYPTPTQPGETAPLPAPPPDNTPAPPPIVQSFGAATNSGGGGGSSSSPSVQTSFEAVQPSQPADSGSSSDSGGGGGGGGSDPGAPIETATTAQTDVAGGGPYGGEVSLPTGSYYDPSLGYSVETGARVGSGPAL